VKKIVKKNIAASVLTVILCAAMLCSAAYAYFQCSVVSSGNRIEAANYDVIVTDKTGNPIQGAYTSVLAQNDLQAFTVMANGSATKGYAVITITDVAATVAAIEEVAEDGDNQTATVSENNSGEGSAPKVYYTPQLKPGSAFKLNVYVAPGYSISFDGKWGTYSGEAEVLTLSGDEATGYMAEIQHSATAYTTYTVQATDTSLDDIANLFNISADDIAAYNGITVLPAVGENIKLPGVTEEAVTLVLDQRRREAVTVYAEYTVAEGDTFESIANAFGIIAEDIMFYNNITELPAVGEIIKLPNVTAEAVTQVLDQRRRDAVTVYAEYTIAEGDTFESVANTFNILTEDIMFYNNITELPAVGEIIKLPNVTAEAVTQVLDQRRRDAVTVYAEYTIAEGDTFESVANTFGILAEDIMFYNNITELPAVGTIIKLPEVTEEAVASALGQSEENIEYETYTVLEGDTWASIAEAYEMEVVALLEYNEMTEETQISAGMELKIPKKASDDSDHTDNDSTEGDNTVGVDSEDDDTTGDSDSTDNGVGQTGEVVTE